MNWLELQLSSASADTKFLLIGHIFPGMYYYGDVELFWNQTFIESYLNILETYADKIIAFSGAHIHTGNIRAPMVALNDSSISSPILINPALSPIY